MMKRASTALILAALLAAPAICQHEQELEAKELIARIKKQMKVIDELLLDVDDSSPTAAKESIEQVTTDIEKLLKTVTEGQAKVIEDIEQLVRMTKYSQSNQGQSGQQDPKSQSQSQNRERDRDAEPDELKQQGEPKQSGADQKQQGEPEGQDEPRDGRADQQEPEQRDATSEAPPPETRQFERENVTGRWGNLPPKVGEMFQQLGPDRFPAKYMKLIDQYYYKANKKKD